VLLFDFSRLITSPGPSRDVMLGYHYYHGLLLKPAAAVESPKGDAYRAREQARVYPVPAIRSKPGGGTATCAPRPHLYLTSRPNYLPLYNPPP